MDYSPDEGGAMTWVILAIVASVGVCGPSWMAQIGEWRRSHSRRMHTSYSGTISAVREIPGGGGIVITLVDATVGQAYSVGDQLSNLRLDVAPSVTLDAPQIEQMLEYAEGWMESQSVVRIEAVRSGRTLLMFTITDELGRGIVHARSEFLEWGERREDQ